MVRLAPVEGARVNESLRRSKVGESHFCGVSAPFVYQRTPLF